MLVRTTVAQKSPAAKALAASMDANAITVTNPDSSPRARRGTAVPRGGSHRTDVDLDIGFGSRSRFTFALHRHFGRVPQAVVRRHARSAR